MKKSICVASAMLLLVLALSNGIAGTAGNGTGSDAKSDSTAQEKARLAEGRRLFDEEAFGGNGRTCLTCHSKKTGTISPQEVEARFELDSADPLFVHDGLDEFDSNCHSVAAQPNSINGIAAEDVDRITTHATIRVEVPLPDYVKLLDEDGNVIDTNCVVFNRGVPSTLNTPALDPALMVDGRAPNLQEQALGAIQGHAQNTIEPTPGQLDLIAEFQQKDKRFFSSNKLWKFANGKKPPRLPDGETASEKRGRAMFDDVPIDPVTKAGICAICHSGPMLNEFNEHNPFFAPPGARFGNVLVSERNRLNDPESDGVTANPVYTFRVYENDDLSCPNEFSCTDIVTPDLGLLATVPRPSEFPPFLPRFFTANFFKIPQLWGVAETAPYFHDNSAKTLEDVAEHYNFFFENDPNLGFSLSEQDQADMVAFMKML